MANTFPEFSRLTPAMLEREIMAQIEASRERVEAIASNPEPPTFANTIVALERAGEPLDEWLNIFYPLSSAIADDETDAIAMRLGAPLSQYGSWVMLHEGLWERVRAVHDSPALPADVEDRRLLEETYRSFVRGGALVQGEARDRLRDIKTRLSELTTLFGQNVRSELNGCRLWLREEELQGIPAVAVSAAREAAADVPEHERLTPWLFTLQAPLYIPLMKHCACRDVRKRAWEMYNARNTSGRYDNLPLITEIVALRQELAEILGFPDYASYKLEHTMAGSPAAVMKLLRDLAEAYAPAWLREKEELQAFAAAKGLFPQEMKPWDYSYVANLLRREQYDFDDEDLRPYFPLENVIGGVFGLARTLYGVTFTERDDVEKYHPDVRVYEMADSDGTTLGWLYADFFPRSGKRPGAWMTEFRPQHHDALGRDVRPLVSIVTNFTKPVGDTPALLTPGEVTTLLHEFGHALHGLFSRCRYASLGGTNVSRDFVELPSQFNENFFLERRFLDSFARHYITGEPIPAEYIDRLRRARRFGAAYACLRQLGFALVDMAWHSAGAVGAAAAELEAAAIAPVATFPAMPGMLFSPQFSHIFAGGYAAGYYSYKWSETLDADAFGWFEQHGVYDPEVARSFRENILERGGTEDAAVLYRRFRGADPSIDALLRRDGVEIACDTAETAEAAGENGAENRDTVAKEEKMS